MLIYLICVCDVLCRYTKTSRSDDSVEHQLELGYVRVKNLLPNEPFPEVTIFNTQNLITYII